MIYVQDTTGYIIVDRVDADLNVPLKDAAAFFVNPASISRLIYALLR